MKLFSARIFKIGINPYVTVPEGILNELFLKASKSKSPIPIKGKLNGKSFKQTLVKYQGVWRLYLNTPMRTAAGVDVGDMATLKIDYDNKPRLVSMPPKLSAALAKNRKAKKEFENLIPSKQKEIMRYINSMRTEESVERNVNRILRFLAGKETFAGRTL